MTIQKESVLQLIDFYHQAGVCFSEVFLQNSWPRRGILCPCGGIKLNFIYMTKSIASLNKVLTLEQQWVDQSHLSFEIVLPQPLCTPEIEDIFKGQGYVLNSKFVAMALDLDGFSSATSPCTW
jgi:hypothetical protein